MRGISEKLRATIERVLHLFSPGKQDETLQPQSVRVTDGESDGGQALIALQRSLQYAAWYMPSETRGRVKEMIPALERFATAKELPRTPFDVLFRWLSTGQRNQLAWTSGDDLRQLGRALWAGFGPTAAQELKAALATQPLFLQETAWNLACWHHSRGQFEQALDQLTLRRVNAPRFGCDPDHVVVEVDTLLGLGRIAEARSRVEEAISRWGELPILCICAANVLACNRAIPRLEADRMRLEWFNKPLSNAGLAPIGFKDPNRPLTFDNLMSLPVGREVRDGPKVSVLMPTFNAGATIGAAIESILNQNWHNLELVAVDDGSSDSTWSVVNDYAARDPRIVPLKHSENRGAYVARNTALRSATGEFVTVSDADDWSHPERLTTQVEHLLQTKLACNTSSSVRVDSDLRVLVLPRARVIRESFPSLMMRREHVLELGGWDEVRMGADAEFYVRLMAKHGQAKTQVIGHAPLMAQLSRADSLTGVSYTGLATTRYGARREYAEASRYWHGLELASEDPKLALPAGRRPFPVPAICEPGRSKKTSCDILWVSDFSPATDAAYSTVAMLLAAKELELRCGCFHWPTLATADHPIDVRVRKLLHAGIADPVVAGQSIECRLVVVADAAILAHLPEILPEIQAGKAVVLMDEAAVKSTIDGVPSPSLDDVLQNAEAVLGLAPTLAPLWPPTRAALLGALPGSPLTADDWLPLVDLSERGDPAAARDRRQPPRIGYQRQYDSCAWRPAQVTFEERICAASVRLGKGCVVVPLDAAEALPSELDFFVWYPDDTVTQGFPYNVLKAMAMNIPVLLPACFKDSFSGAAIYAEREAILPAIEVLWSDQTAYEAQAKAGREFVARNCGRSSFEQRISNQLGPVRPFSQSPESGLSQRAEANLTAEISDGYAASELR